MSPKVSQVEALANYRLKLSFDNGEVRVFDVTPYVSKGVFQALQAVDYFKQVKPFFGGVQWPQEQDFSADTLYLESVVVEQQGAA
ncbi:MAG: DUF2442 domain-containing protein [Cyanobacteria bacterium J06560_6]